MPPWPRNPSSCVGLALLCALVGLTPRELDSTPLLWPRREHPSGHGSGRALSHFGACHLLGTRAPGMHKRFLAQNRTIREFRGRGLHVVFVFRPSLDLLCASPRQIIGAWQVLLDACYNVRYLCLGAGAGRFLPTAVSDVCGSVRLVSDMFFRAMRFRLMRSGLWRNFWAPRPLFVSLVSEDSAAFREPPEVPQHNTWRPQYPPRRG
jgi:hypothetical protein